MARRDMAKYWKCAFVIALMVGVPWVGYKLYIRSHHLSFVPDALSVSNVLYASEQSWGFGPGGNETGLLAFQLPAAVVQQLKTRGTDYLENMPQNARQGWQGRYTDWHKTPLVMDDHWGASSYDGRKSCTSSCIGDYLNQYGFSIPLEKKWEDMANRALSIPGSYYAYGRIGIIIIIPDELRVIYAYSG